jgi:ribonuclease J
VEAARTLNPVTLICEGTHVDVDSTIDEATVYARSLDIIQNCRSLVIADFGPRNLERLLTFREIALDCKRKLVVTAKDIYLLEEASLASDLIIPPQQDEVLYLYKEPKRLDKWEEQVYARYEHRSIDPQEVKRNGADYILCFSFWDINELIEIDPESGTVYIYSSSEAFDEEQKFDIVRLRNWLNLFQMQPAGVPDGHTGKVPDWEQGFHSSGHISGTDLLELIETINPQFIIPVHTNNQEFFKRNISSSKLHIPTRGVPIIL